MARDSVTHHEPPKVQMVRESHNMRGVGGVRAAAVTTTVNHAVYIQEVVYTASQLIWTASMAGGRYPREGPREV